MVDRTYSLGAVPDAIRYLRAGQARGKMVITIRRHVGALGQAAPSSPMAFGDG